MGIFKLIDFIENLILSIAWWIIIIPKTMFVTLFKPTKISSYISAQWRLSRQDRFKNGISPILFFLLAGFTPLFISFYNWSNVSDFLISILHSTWGTETIIIVLSLFIISGPIAFAFVLLFLQKKGTDKELFEYLFSVQCLIFTPVLLLISIGNIFYMFYFEFVILFWYVDIIKLVVSIFIFSIAFLWFIIAESIVIIQHLPAEKYRHKTISTILVFIFSVCLWIGIVLAYYFILGWILELLNTAIIA